MFSVALADSIDWSSVETIKEFARRDKETFTKEYLNLTPEQRRVIDQILSMQPDGEVDEEPDYTNRGVFGNQMDKYYENPDNKPGLAERTVSDIILAIPNYILRALGLQDVTILVFGKNPNPTEDGFLQGDCVGKNDCREGLYLGVFSEGMMSAIAAIYDGFERFLPYPLVIGLLIIGFLTLYYGMTAEGRSKYKDYASAFLVALIAIRFGHYLWIFATNVINYFIDLIWAIMIKHDIRPDFFLNMIWGSGSSGYDSMVSHRGFALALVVLVAVISSVMINYQYAIRYIMLSVLLAAFPICCVLTIYPKYRHSLQTWWDEFLSNLLLPLAHSLALGLFFLLLRYSSDEVSVWIIIAYFFALPVITNVVRRLVGAQESGGGTWGALGTMAGIGGVMALKKMFSEKKDNQGKKHLGTGQSLDKAQSGENESRNVSQNNVGNINGIKGFGKRHFGSTGASLNTVGKVAGFGIKAAGTATGIAFGAMAGNPTAGAAVGTMTGGWASKGVAKTFSGIGKGVDHLVHKVRGTSANQTAVPTTNSSSENTVQTQAQQQIFATASPIAHDAYQTPRMVGKRRGRRNISSDIRSKKYRENEQSNKDFSVVPQSTTEIESGQTEVMPISQNSAVRSRKSSFQSKKQPERNNKMRNNQRSRNETNPNSSPNHASNRTSRRGSSKNYDYYL